VTRSRKPFSGRKGAREAPRTPVPGRTFHDLRVGDRVRVTQSGRKGEIVGPHRHHVGWRVRWDEPLFGVIEGNVSWPLLEPEEET